jgi:hypothetical protein
MALHVSKKPVLEYKYYQMNTGECQSQIPDDGLMSQNMF